MIADMVPISADDLGGVAGSDKHSVHDIKRPNHEFLESAIAYREYYKHYYNAGK